MPLTFATSVTVKAMFNCASKVINSFFFQFALCLFRKLALLAQPIRCQAKANHNLVARVFPRFVQFCWLYLQFSLALIGLFFSSDWPL